MEKTWVRLAFGLFVGLFCLTLSRAALVESPAVEEPLLDHPEAVSFGRAPQKVARPDGPTRPTQQPSTMPSTMDPRARTRDDGARDTQIALRSTTNGHIIAPVAADSDANDHRGGYYWWSEGYRPAAIGGLLALGGIFGGLCAAGELGCEHSHGQSPPNPPGPPPHPPHPPHPPVPPGPPPHPPVSPFH